MLVLKSVKTSAGPFRLGPISFEMEREYLVVLGPSGAGKSMLLEVIAGFRKAKGKILLNGFEINSLTPEKRNIGFLMQEPLLFPHMSVIENIRFGAKGKDFEGLIDKLKISGLVERDVNSLSGGEKQRVALARALATHPHLLLLDEPFSWLDRGIREIIQDEVKTLSKELNLPVLHVTHNFEEAFSVGDRVIILRNGKVVQDGNPEEIFKNPVDEFVAKFTGNQNIYEGTIEFEGECAFFQNEKVRFFMGKDKKLEDGSAKVVIPSQEILVSSFPLDGEEGDNIIEGFVSSLSFKGNIYQIVIDCGIKISTFLSPQEVEKENIKQSKRVYIKIKPSSIRVIR